MMITTMRDKPIKAPRKENRDNEWTEIDIQSNKTKEKSGEQRKKLD